MFVQIAWVVDALGSYGHASPRLSHRLSNQLHIAAGDPRPQPSFHVSEHAQCATAPAHMHRPSRWKLHATRGLKHLLRLCWKTRHHREMCVLPPALLPGPSRPWSPLIVRLEYFPDRFEQSQREQTMFCRRNSSYLPRIEGWLGWQRCGVIECGTAGDDVVRSLPIRTEIGTSSQAGVYRRRMALSS